MSVIPCSQNEDLRKLIESYAEALKVEAHKLGSHGLNEADFYNSGLFRGAIERIRGQFSATMREKREFARDILNYMQDGDIFANGVIRRRQSPRLHCSTPERPCRRYRIKGLSRRQ